MTIYTLPKLARALGVGYGVVYSLRQRGYLMPTQVNGSQEYYTLDDYQAAAARSVEEWKERRNEIARPYGRHRQKGQNNRIDYSKIF